MNCAHPVLATLCFVIAIVAGLLLVFVLIWGSLDGPKADEGPTNNHERQWRQLCSAKWTPTWPDRDLLATLSQAQQIEKITHEAAEDIERKWPDNTELSRLAWDTHSSCCKVLDLLFSKFGREMHKK